MDATSDRTVICICDGTLVLLRSDGGRQEPASAFVAERVADGDRERALHGWKATGGERGLFGQPQTWGGRGTRPAPSRWRTTAVAPGPGGAIHYLLENGSVTGLFRYHPDQDEELRLCHRNDWQVHGLDWRAGQGFIAGIQGTDGTVHLHRLSDEGRSLGTVTAGDVRDSLPAYSLKDPGVVVYASAGIGRDEHGTAVAVGPSAVCRLDLRSGHQEEVLHHPQHDYLAPQEGPDGDLWCIRRPYRPAGYLPWWRSLLDMLLFPVHFIIALMQFLRTFTALFHRGPAVPLGPRSQPPAHRHVHILGETIAVAKARRTTGDGPALVPDGWELIRRSRSGTVTVVAKGVAAFRLGADGTLWISSGLRLDERAGSDRRTRLRDELVEAILA